MGVLKRLYQVCMFIPATVLYVVGTLLYNIVFYVFKGDIINTPHVTIVDKYITKILLLKD